MRSGKEGKVRLERFQEERFFSYPSLMGRNRKGNTTLCGRNLQRRRGTAQRDFFSWKWFLMLRIPEPGSPTSAVLHLECLFRILVFLFYFFFSPKDYCPHELPLIGTPGYACLSILGSLIVDVITEGMSLIIIELPPIFILTSMFTIVWFSLSISSSSITR